MAVVHMDFAACVPVLSTCPMPVWVFAVATFEFYWANQPGVEFWKARDLDELRGHSPLEGVPEKVVARSLDIVERVRKGECPREEWTLYPKGEAVTVVLHYYGMTLPDGGFGLMMYAVPTAPEMPDSILRSIAMFRHTGIISVFVAADGRIHWQNPIATETFGEAESWLSWLGDPREGERILGQVIGGEGVEARVRTMIGGESRWYLIEAHALRDPVTGELGVLIEHVDVSAGVEAELLADSRGQTIDALREALTLVERQRQEIVELSAPMLDVGDHTLAVPIIGRLDEAQSEAITTKLLEAVAARRIRRVILDVTGLATIDVGVAHRLHRMIKTLRLLGATPMITGARPQLALELADSGLALDEVATLRSLAEGLRRARA